MEQPSCLRQFTSHSKTKDWRPINVSWITDSSCGFIGIFLLNWVKTTTGMIQKEPLTLVGCKTEASVIWAAERDGGGGGAAKARDGWFKSHSRGWGQHQGHCSDASLFHSSVSSLALPQLPSEKQRMECHKAKLLSGSICSVRLTLPGFIKFLPILFSFQQSASPVKISLWQC